MRVLLIGILTYAVMAMVSCALVMSGAAGAEQNKKENWMPIPWEYNYPYRGKLTVKWVDPHKTQEECKINAGAFKYVAACALNNDNNTEECTVILPKKTGVYLDKYHEYLWMHETAHCNGWRHGQ